MSATRKQLDVLLGDNAFFTVKEVAKVSSISKVYKCQYVKKKIELADLG